MRTLFWLRVHQLFFFLPHFLLKIKKTHPLPTPHSPLPSFILYNPSVTKYTYLYKKVTEYFRGTGCGCGKWEWLYLFYFYFIYYKRARYVIDKCVWGEAFCKCSRINKQKRDWNGIWLRVKVWGDRSKRRKTPKVRDMKPLLWVYKGLVVVMRGVLRYNLTYNVNL